MENLCAHIRIINLLLLMVPCVTFMVFSTVLMNTRTETYGLFSDNIMHDC
jgi:hypothetical protein